MKEKIVINRIYIITVVYLTEEKSDLKVNIKDD